MADAWDYLRYSSDMQDNNTLDAQHSHIVDVAKKLGDEISLTFDDAAMSGRSGIDREDFMRMLTAAKEAAVRPKRIYVYSWSRFMRDNFEALLFKRLFQNLGIEIVSATEPLPEEEQTAELMEGIIHTINQYQSRVIGAQSLAGTKQIVRAGYWSGGPPPFGYRLVKVENSEGYCRSGEIVVRSRLQIEESEAAIVRRIFALAAETGLGGHCIYKQLCQEMGGPVLGRKRKPLDGRGVNAILRNPIYKGTIIYNDHGYRKALTNPMEGLA